MNLPARNETPYLSVFYESQHLKLSNLLFCWLNRLRDLYSAHNLKSRLSSVVKRTLGVTVFTAFNLRLYIGNLTTYHPTHFNKMGVSSSASFEQISMQRLTGVPTPISGGTGWVGSGQGEIGKHYPTAIKFKTNIRKSWELVSYKLNFIDMFYGM